MVIYVVEREGGDGLETDLFTDLKLAEKWRQVCNGRLREETIFTEEFTEEMIKTHTEDDL